MTVDNPDDYGPDDLITCWCGATGAYEGLFDTALFDQDCGGSGWLECHCGGDQCVCHHHGQAVECPGCDDCEHEDPEYDPDDYP